MHFEQIHDNLNHINYSEENYAKLNITLNHYAIRNKEDYDKKYKQLETGSKCKQKIIKGLFEIINLPTEQFVNANVPF